MAGYQTIRIGQEGVLFLSEEFCGSEMSENPFPAAAEHQFTDEDIAGFDQDDGQAGAAICKMLTMFFVYTIIAMGLCVYFTSRWIAGVTFN